MTGDNSLPFDHFWEKAGHGLTISSLECFIPEQSLCDCSNLGARIAQLVEHMTENPGVGGSSPPPGTILQVQADVAQSVEQLTRNEQVCGSIPHVGSIALKLPPYNSINVLPRFSVYDRKVLLCN